MPVGRIVSNGVSNRSNKAWIAAFWERYRRHILRAALPLAMVAPAWSADYQVTSTADTSDPGTLRWAIEQANANPAQADKITFNLPYGHETIELSSYLPIINKTGGSLEIIGQGTTVVDGQSQHRPFFVNAGSVTISNLTIQNGLAQGGNGGDATSTGGGGGLGAGGAIFVRDGASVTVDAVNFLGNAAAGGQGGTHGGGTFISGAGGGGLGGDGGSGVGQSGGGGGGGALPGQDGLAAAGNNGGDGGGPYGGVGGAGTGGIPGGAGGDLSGGGGGGGSGAAAGGAGGFGGGGGGATSYITAPGGTGGFGGGGGSSPIGSGNGGFGGGGGGAFSGQGTGGFGGGNGSGPNGGGGAAFGGAIFVMDGASLTVKDSAFSQGSVTVGLGGGSNLANAGMAAGSAFFLQDTDVTIEVTGTNEVTIADTIADAAGNSQPGGIIKTGTGTLILSGTNTYTGGTSFNEGVVAITSGDNLGTGALSFNGGTLRTDASVTLTNNFDLQSGGGTIDTNGYDSTLSGSLSGTGDLTKAGAGSLGLSGFHFYSGDILLNAGTLALSGGITTLGSGSIQANGGSLYFYNGTNSQTLYNDIVLNSDLTIEQNNPLPGGGTTILYGDLSGSGELTIQRSDGSYGAALWLQGNNSGFNGALNIQGGWVEARTSNALNQQNNVAIADGAILSINTNREVIIGDLTGEGEVVLYGGTKVTVGTGNDSIFDGRFVQMSGTGNFEKVGTGSLTLTGENAWNGHALLHGGTTTVSAGKLIGSTSAFYDKDITNNATVVFDQDTDGTYGGVMSGSGILVKTGTGTVTLSETNTYQGGTSLNEGVLAVSSENNLGTGALNFNGGTLRTNASMTTSRAISLGLNGGTIDTNGFDSVITTNSFTIGGVGTFTKIGEGTLTVQNDYGIAADVVVDEGTLQYADQGGYFGSMTVTVNDGGLFRASSNAPNVVVNSGGSLEAGTTTSVGYVYLESLTMNDGAILNMRLGQADVEGGSYNDFIYVSGDVTLDGTLNLSNSQVTEFEFGTYALMGYSGTLTNNGITVGDMPEGMTDAELQFLADTKRVNVVLSGALFFNGAVTHADGIVHGGSGVWDDSTTNWTNPGGTTEKAWKDKVGVFAGPAGGTVSIAGEQTFTGLQFSTNGYELVDGDNGSLLLNGNGQIRVDDSITATISAPLTGTGSLEKLDDGTLILSGTNTYTGGTTVTGGTLQGDTNSLQGDITNNASLVFDQSFDGSFDDTISGTGLLVKNGSGSVTLSGTNTYSGGTTINSGTLAVTDDTNLGDVSGDLTFNGGTLRYGSDYSIDRKIILESGGGTIEVLDGVGVPTISGEISGTGSLTLAGPGSLFLTNGGVNSYSGGTILNGGTLHVFQDANLGDVSGDLTLNGGRIFFRESATFARDVVLGGDSDILVADGVTTILTGEISGVNSLNLSSGLNGTLILDGSNTYTGGTNVLTGTLRLGSHGSLASTGALTIEADGIFDLNDNTQTVGTLSGAGSLLLGDGEFTTDTSADSIFSGVISGNGSFTKDGSGRLELTGIHTYTGGTTVEGGELKINGSLASVVTVGADGRLSGTGVLAGLNNQGLLAPGNSIGTLVVNGNAQLQSTGTLEIEINDGSAVPEPGINNDLIDVQGTAELGGTVNVLADNVAGNFTNGTEFYFLRASDGFGGSEFDGVTDNLAFFDAILGYRQGTASEEFAYFWLKANETNFRFHAGTTNKWQIANYLDQNYNSATGPVEVLYNQLMGMTNEQLSSAFDQMTGEVYASLAQLAIQNMLQNQLLLRQNLFSNSAAADWLAARDSSAPIIDANGNALVLVQNPETGELEWAAIRAQDRADWRGWISGYGVGGTAGSDGNASSAKYAIGGTTFGADREIDKQTRLGLHGSYANLNLNTRNGLQSTESDAVQFGSYLLRNHQDARYTLASFGIGFNDYDSRRSVLGQTATGDTNGWQANTWLEHGLRFETRSVTLQPFTALQYLYVGQNDFRENGAGVLNLDVEGLDTHALRGVLGASVARPFETGRGLLVPTFHAMWLHEFLDTSSVLNTTFASVGGSSFATRGLDYGRDWAVLGSGLQWETGRNWSVLLNYDLQFNAVQTFHMGSGAVQFQW
ncbi:MAG: autotransporter domain-containing protein [Planctomycetaceae bacterium]|nr:autotransporter domain-containing protein [Planctomycetaceae bacterium]